MFCKKDYFCKNIFKMTKTINILAFIFSLLIVFSCEPSRDDNGDLLNGLINNGSGENPTSTRLLKKINSHEKNDVGEWEDTEMVFNYSGSKLISTSDESGVTTFEYNSNNKISKIKNTGQNTTLEYSGGSVSKMITEIAGGFGKITTTYTYTAGKLSKSISTQEYTFPFPVKIYLESTYQFAGENMIKLVAHAGVYLPDGTLEMDDRPTMADFTYDAKKSPYKLLPQEFAIYLAGVGPQGAAFLSTNNVTKYKVVNNDGTSEEVNYNHTYDSEDYVEMTTGIDGGSVKYTYQ